MIPNEEMRFARALRTRREALGWSQSELARRMADAGWSSYSQMTISRTEKGDRPVRLAEAHALARILEYSLDEMISPAPDVAVATRLSAAIEALDHRAGAIASALNAWRGAARDAEQAIADYDARRPLTPADLESFAADLRSIAHLLSSDLDRVISWADSDDADPLLVALVPDPDLIGRYYGGIGG